MANSITLGSMKMQGRDALRVWSDTCGSTSVSSASNGAYSDSEDSTCWPTKQRRETCDAFIEFRSDLKLKNSFFEFPVSLWEEEYSGAARQRSQSAPGRSSPSGVDLSHDHCKLPSTALLAASPYATAVDAESLMPSSTTDASQFGSAYPSAFAPIQVVSLGWIMPTQSAVVLMPVSVPSHYVLSHTLPADPSSFEGSLEDHNNEESSDNDSPLLLSEGSRNHHSDRSFCRPCAFINKRGCQSGLACTFCHICGPEVRRKRQLARLDRKRKEYKNQKKRERDAFDGIA